MNSKYVEDLDNEIRAALGKHMKFTVQKKVALGTRIGWGAVMLFGLLGMLFGNQDQATAVLVISSVGWVVTTVIVEGLMAIGTWRAATEIEDTFNLEKTIEEPPRNHLHVVKTPRDNDNE